MSVLGTVRNGKVELQPGVSLPEGTRVMVKPLAISDPIEGLADEAVPTGIRDLASRHDSVVYGTPKRGE